MIMKCTWLTIENTCRSCITKGTHGVQSHDSKQARDMVRTTIVWPAGCG